jgi:hypothetical protein
MSDATITLAAAIGPNDEFITVSAAGTGHVAPFVGYVDSEAIYFTEGTNGTAWRARRGWNDTVKTGHAISSAITIISPNPIDRGASAAAAIAQSNLQTAIPQAVLTEERTFIETAGDGVYTATVAIPAGATVLDVIFRNTALWTAGTSALLVVGDDDSVNGYIASTSVKAAPIADTAGAGAGFSTALSLGATLGAYAGGAGKFCAAAKTITATITKIGTGTAGRSRLLVKYALPHSTAVAKV